MLICCLQLVEKLHILYFLGLTRHICHQRAAQVLNPSEHIICSVCAVLLAAVITILLPSGSVLAGERFRGMYIQRPPMRAHTVREVGAQPSRKQSSSDSRLSVIRTPSCDAHFRIYKIVIIFTCEACPKHSTYILTTILHNCIFHSDLSPLWFACRLQAPKPGCLADCCLCTVGHMMPEEQAPTGEAGNFPASSNSMETFIQEQRWSSGMISLYLYVLVYQNRDHSNHAKDHTNRGTRWEFCVQGFVLGGDQGDY